MGSNIQSTTAQASELGGQTVAITSGADTRIVGFNVLADQRLDINAGGQFNIEAAENTQSDSSLGLPGLDVTFRKQQQSTDARTTWATPKAAAP